MRLSYRLLFTCAILLAGMPVAHADLAEGLVGHWTLDSEDIIDESGAGHDGQVIAGGPKLVEGKIGMALEFDGATDIEIADHEDFHLTDAVSVALWAKPEDGQASWAKFFVKQKSGEYPYSLQFDDGQAIFATVNTAARSDTAPKLPNFVGEWGHLTFTYDGDALILYKDGVEVARNDNAEGELAQNDLSLSIGSRLGSNQDFKGVIDDVFLYNRALTPPEIRQVMEGNLLAVDSLGKLAIQWAVLKQTRF